MLASRASGYVRMCAADVQTEYVCCQLYGRIFQAILLNMIEERWGEKKNTFISSSRRYRVDLD